MISVYEVDPYPRAAEQILERKQQPKGSRPQLEKKRC